MAAGDIEGPIKVIPTESSDTSDILLLDTDREESAQAWAKMPAFAGVKCLGGCQNIGGDTGDIARQDPADRSHTSTEKAGRWPSGIRYDLEMGTQPAGYSQVSQ